MSIEPLAYNPTEPQQQQLLDWTCSACSLAWMNRALGIQFATDEPSATDYIGVPDNINAMYGLMDASGSRLVQCLREQGAPAFNCWPSWSQIDQLAQYMPMLLGGVGWNHWVGVRGTDGTNLLLANSAEGWQGVYDTMNSSQFVALGPFAAVPVPLLRQFPSLPQA